MKSWNVYIGVYCNDEQYEGTLLANTEEDASEMVWDMVCDIYDSYEDFDEEEELEYSDCVNSIVSYYVIETEKDTELKEEIYYLN